MTKRDDDRWRKRLQKVSEEIRADREGKPHTGRRAKRRPNTSLITDRIKDLDDCSTTKP